MHQRGIDPRQDLPRCADGRSRTSAIPATAWHHFGYGTRAHLRALVQLGPCAIHRRSFNPVAQLAVEACRPAAALRSLAPMSPTDDSMTRFVHLRLHTEYSLIDSVVRVPELIEAVAAAGMPAVALTDQGNLFAMVKFYRAALERGVQPIIGVDLLLREPDEKQRPSRLTLLCQNADRLSQSRPTRQPRLSARARARGVPLVDRALAEREQHRRPDRAVRRRRGRHRPRAAARSRAAGRAGARLLARAVRRPLLHRAAAARAARRSSSTCRRHCSWRRAAACRWSPPTMCASCAPRISSRTRRACASTMARCWPTPRGRAATRRSSTCAAPAEMAALFADLPEALANTVEIARRCSLRADARPGAAAGLSGAGRRPRRTNSCARRPSAGLRARLAALQLAAERRRSATAHGWPPSSTSSARWGSPATS